jgi:hypothetical protein
MESNLSDKENRQKWWQQKRLIFNIGLIISGLTAFVFYAIVLYSVVPYDTDVEITLFTIIPQALGYVMMIGIANICFQLGAYSEELIKPKNIELYRIRTFKIGFWFSCGLPFLIPILLLVSYS